MTSTESLNSALNLCVICEQICRRNPHIDAAGDSWVETGQDFRQWRTSLASGCAFCQKRWDCLDPKLGDRIGDSKDVSVAYQLAFKEYLHTEPRAVAQLELRFRYRYGTGNYRDYFDQSFDLEKLVGQPFKGLVGDTTSSRESVVTIQRWLETCDSTHTACASTLGPRFRPTRLLSIDRSSVRLCLGSTLDTNIRYAALSHCWGAAVPLKLRKAVTAEFEKGIDQAKLPKTFSEAVRMARMLGIKYLWIDSLCIIQDSPEDWQHEAALMGRVYESSWCVFSASKAQDSSAGLFSDRSSARIDYGLACIMACWDSVQAEAWACWYPQRFLSQVNDSLISSRGWVLQERVLAQRIIHWVHGQIFWECKHLMACESHPLGLPLGPTRTDYKPSLMSTDESRADRGASSALWMNFVQAYCKAALSKPAQDKYVAISGIARKLGPAKRYVAGLWKASIIKQLCWRTIGAKAGRPSQWRAPSWSWISIDGALTCSRLLSGKISRLVDARLEYATSDRFGPLHSGALVVEGPLFTLMSDDMNSMDGNDRATSSSLYWHPIGIEWKVYLDEEIRSVDEPLICLFLCYDASELGGIILRRTSVAGTYVRRGAFSLESSPPSLDVDDSDPDSDSESKSSAYFQEHARAHWSGLLSVFTNIVSEMDFAGPLVGRQNVFRLPMYRITLI